jgi:hypothetical protein
MVRLAFTKFWKFWKLQSTDKNSRILVCFAQRNWPFQRRSQLFSSAIQFQALADIVRIISKIFPIKPTNFWVRKAAVVPPGYFFVAKQWSLTLRGAARITQGLTVQPCAVARGGKSPWGPSPDHLPYGRVQKLPDPESKGLGSHAWACPDYCEMTQPGVPVQFKILAKDLPASAGQYTILN